MSLLIDNNNDYRAVGHLTTQRLAGLLELEPFEVQAQIGLFQLSSAYHIDAPRAGPFHRKK